MWRVVAVLACACNSNPYATSGSAGSAAPAAPVPFVPSVPPVQANDRCEVNSDCAIVAPPTDACCPHSGIPIAVTLERRAKLSSLAERTCSQDQVVACPPPVAQDHWPDAVCKDHACVAEKRVLVTTLDLAAFSHACATDADCALVERDRCNPCRCQDVPIAAKERRRYLAAFGALSCTEHGRAVEATITPCVHCDAMVPVCTNGTCSAKSTEPMPEDGECKSDADCVVSCATSEACCETGPCETVMSRTALAEVHKHQPAGCKAAKCRAPEPASYVTPRCKVGKCFAAFDSGLPGH